MLETLEPEVGQGVIVEYVVAAAGGQGGGGGSREFSDCHVVHFTNIFFSQGIEATARIDLGTLCNETFNQNIFIATSPFLLMV